MKRRGADIRDTIFHQRPLKPTVVGKCTFVPEETRLPKAMPSVEARVIYEMLNQLRFGDGIRERQVGAEGWLSIEQRDGAGGQKDQIHPVRSPTRNSEEALFINRNKPREYAGWPNSQNAAKAIACSILTKNFLP